ncbi:MAG: AAA family ATPase [Syntrophales bacterium LBB04]|nr:AAA family ATPase [Syntrophales bacterium LBB04]
MYLEYWGFKQFPFENVPDPSFFYLSRSHEEGLTRLLYAAKMRKGGAMLSGEIGCGKTTLTKVCVQELSGEKFDIGLIVNPKLEPLEFLQEVLYQFGINDVPETKVKCLRALNDKMLENMKSGRETLLMVDEAQLLSQATLEEIRLLLNFQLNDRFLITVILLGQPELKDKIRAIEQLEQRIAIKYHLAPFDFNDTARYVLFRQKKAGGNANVFSKEAIERIYEHTKGVPRKINNLCDLSLLIGFSKSEKVISSVTIESIIKDGALL